MPTQPTKNSNSDGNERDRCYGCFRPRRDCFCEAIPSIDNKTDVLILQHMRERFHPFNTARIVQRALKQSTLLVDHNSRLAATNLPLKPRAGLLYPGPEATLISDLPADQHPEQLVILDGTWHHAKTLVRDIPALHGLPRYRLAPASPGRYRIRREPDAMSLSTLEATVAALRALEPNTAGLDQLLGVFDGMVERQLAHPKQEYGWRRNEKRNRTPLNIPRALLGDLGNIVVAYGESSPGVRGERRAARLPVYWVAQRLGSGERFACAIEPESPLSDVFLGHLELTDDDFAAALSPSDFPAAWADFLRPNDTLVVYSQSTSRLLSHIGCRSGTCLVLKSVQVHPDRPNGTPAELLAALQLESAPAEHPGRAGNRLANAVALVRHFHALGSAAL